MAKKQLNPEPWERQPNETPRAYEAFTVYRDLGRGRSIAKAARKEGKAKVTWEKWSRANNWVERVAAWDAEQDRISRQAQLDDIKKMRKRHADLASAMLIKAARALQRIPEDEIKAADISRMVDTASKLERISRGDVGDVVEERDGGRSENPVQFYLPDNHREPTETTTAAIDEEQDEDYGEEI